MKVRYRIVPRSPIESILWRAYMALHLPVRWWRKYFYRLSPFHRILVSQKFEVGIFPSADEHSFLAPIPRTICSIHDLMHRYESEFPEVGKPLVVHYREFLYRNICRYANLILTDSELGRKHLLDSYGRQLCTTRALPYIPPDYMSEGLKQQVRLPHLPEKFLFYPAQFWEHKNHLRLIEALGRLHSSGIKANLVLVGSKKNNYHKVMASIEKLGLGAYVYVLGYVSNEEMVSLYQRCHALIMPTFFGPTNIPPLEAILVGRPVAVSRIYAMPDQLGQAALYFDPRSVDEIYGAMKILWDDTETCLRIISSGRELAKTLNQSAFNARFLDALEAVIS